MLTVTLAGEGPGAGRFAIGGGTDRGLSITSALAEPIVFSRFSLAPYELSLVLAADTDMLELQLQAEAPDLGLRGHVSVPRGATFRIMTAYDHTTVVEQSSWWVLFGAEASDGRSRYAAPPPPKPAPPKEQ